ncbi:MAG: hydrogenase maturation nickel metallochaperone HypA [Bacteroidota bacterium]
MHELSLAINIVEMAENLAREHHASSVSAIKLEVGEGAGVEMPALKTALQSACMNTLLQEASVEYIRTPIENTCTECGFAFASKDMYSLCPKCGSFAKVTGGKDLKILSITTEKND